MEPASIPVTREARLPGRSLAFGFLVLAVALTVVGVSDLGWLDSDEGWFLAVVLLTFAAPLQFLSAVLAFVARDGFGATGLALFAGSWATLGTGDLLTPPGDTSPTLGVFWLAFAAAVGLVAYAATRRRQRVIAAVFSLGAARAFTVSLVEFTGVDGLLAVAGVLGLAAAGLALVAAAVLLRTGRWRRGAFTAAIRQARESLAGPEGLRVPAESAGR